MSARNAPPDSARLIATARRNLTRAACALLVGALLASCAQGGGAPGRSDAGRSSTEPSPPGATSPTETPSPSRTSGNAANQRPRRELYVDGVTVYLCRRCVRLARQAGIDLAAVMTRSVRRVASLLPLSTGSVTVDVQIGRIDIGHEVHVLGLATDDDTRVSIPRDPDVLRRLGAWVPTIAHELHHTVRDTIGPGTTGTLLDRLIGEGTAVAFEEQAFPRFATHYWDHVLRPSEEAATWRALRPHLQDSIVSRPSLVRYWFLGGGEVPDGAGYVIGYHIVKGFLARHPSSSPARLATVDSETVLAGSGYSG